MTKDWTIRIKPDENLLPWILLLDISSPFLANKSLRGLKIKLYGIIQWRTNNANTINNRRQELPFLHNDVLDWTKDMKRKIIFNKVIQQNNHDYAVYSSEDDRSCQWAVSRTVSPKSNCGNYYQIESSKEMGFMKMWGYLGHSRLENRINNKWSRMNTILRQWQTAIDDAHDQGLPSPRTVFSKAFSVNSEANGRETSSLGPRDTKRIACSELTTPENIITYHNALCLSPKNFA